MKTITFVIVVLMGFSSCTITKRVHNPGWHVAWRNNHSAETNQSLHEHGQSAELDTVSDHAKSDNDETVALAQQVTFDRTGIKVNDDRSYNTDAMVASEALEQSDALAKKHESALSKNPSRLLDDELTVDGRQLNPHISKALTTMLLSLLCLALLFLGFSGFFAFLCWVGILITGSVTIKSSMKGLKEMKAQPEVWKGLGLATFLLIFGIIEVSVMVIYVFVVFILLMNGVIDSIKEFTIGFDGFM